MAIVKTVNRSTKNNGALKICLRYISKRNEVNKELCYISGPTNLVEFDYNEVYKEFINEKVLWNKNSRRMYMHNIISFHKDEEISIEEVYEFGREFVDKWFDGYQSAMVVHTEKDHKHIHIVTNTVSYIDGKKHHQSKRDLQKMKEFVNEMSRSRDLSISEKGKDFYGNTIEKRTIRAWSKDKYNLLKNNSKESFLNSAVEAIHKAVYKCESRGEFVTRLKELGWSINISDKRKYMTLENESGQKVRDKMLSDTFCINFNKESLEKEFAINRGDIQRESPVKLKDEEFLEREFNPYYEEVEKAIDIDDIDDIDIEEPNYFGNEWMLEAERLRDISKTKCKEKNKKKYDDNEHER